MPTDDVENTNGTNYGENIGFANKPRTVLQGTERMSQVDISTGELLYIDQHTLEEKKIKRKNLAMAGITNKKAYDMIPQSWIIACLKMNKISGEVIKFIENIVEN